MYISARLVEWPRGHQFINTDTIEHWSAFSTLESRVNRTENKMSTSTCYSQVSRPVGQSNTSTGRLHVDNNTSYGTGSRNSSHHGCDHCSDKQDIFRYLFIHALSDLSSSGPSRLRTQYTFEEPSLRAPPALPSSLAMMMMNQSLALWKSIVPVIPQPALPCKSVRPRSQIFGVDICAPSPRIYK